VLLEKDTTWQRIVILLVPNNRLEAEFASIKELSKLCVLAVVFNLGGPLNRRQDERIRISRLDSLSFLCQDLLLNCREVGI
jgi:hypothetical protein